MLPSEVTRSVRLVRRVIPPTHLALSALLRSASRLEINVRLEGVATSVAVASPAAESQRLLVPGSAHVGSQENVPRKDGFAVTGCHVAREPSASIKQNTESKSVCRKHAKRMVPSSVYGRRYPPSPQAKEDILKIIGK